MAAPADLARRAVDGGEVDIVDAAAATAIEQRFDEVSRPRSFDASVVAARTSLEGCDARPYEDALVLMGRLAGADTSAGDGAPARNSQDLWIGFFR